MVSAGIPLTKMRTDVIVEPLTRGGACEKHVGVRPGSEDLPKCSESHPSHLLEKLPTEAGNRL